MGTIKYLAARFREPSTFAGLGLIAVGIAKISAGNLVEGVTEIVSGLGAVLFKEGGRA